LKAVHCDRYNFNNDGLVTKEDIRILLSYVPMQSPEDEEDKNGDMSDTRSAKSSKSKGSEGLYNSRKQTFLQRQED